jgi:hypothetical protein
MGKGLELVRKLHLSLVSVAGAYDLYCMVARVQC